MSEQEAGRSHTVGKVYLVGAGPGDPGLLTLRGLECLQMADIVIYDRLVNPVLLRHAHCARMVAVGKSPDHHPVPQDEINAILVDQAVKGHQVVRLKGGDPFVFGRGGEEALALAEAGIPFEIVPGISSAVAVPAYAGIPVTQRNLAGSFSVIAGHRSADELTVELARNPALDADTVVFLMGVQNLPAIVKALIARGRKMTVPIALIEQGTLHTQKVVSGTLENILELSARIRPPAVTIVGEVVHLRERLTWFERMGDRPLRGLRLLHTRPKDLDRQDNFRIRMEKLGAAVYHQPAFQIVPPEDLTELDSILHQMSRGETWDWIFFSSPNAVDYFLNRLFDLGFDTRLLAGIHLGTVGDATRQALMEYHLKSDFTPTRFSGLDWAAQVGNLDGCRVLLPRSAIAPPDLVNDLMSRNAQVTAVSTYSIASAQPEMTALQAWLDGEIDLIVFFSPSGVRGLIDMLHAVFGDEQANAGLKRTHMACIGQTTAMELEKYGLRADVIAVEQSGPGLEDAILKWHTP